VRGKALARFDANNDFHMWIARRAGLSACINERQDWTVGENRLTVSWWLEERNYVVLSIHAGWAGSGRKTLCLAEVFAACVTGRLRLMRGMELARWKARALIESGLVPTPQVMMPVLPPDAPAHAVATWNAIGRLMQARRVLDELPGDPTPLVVPFLVRWSGEPEHVLRAGKTWLEAHRYIDHVGNYVGNDGKEKLTFGNPTYMWVVVEELSANPNRAYLVPA
jgi:hypothetical protein